MLSGPPVVVVRGLALGWDGEVGYYGETGSSGWKLCVFFLTAIPSVRDRGFPNHHGYG